MKTAEELLAAAADLVEQSWAQGDANVNYVDGPYCAGIALAVAAEDNYCEERFTVEFERAIHAFCQQIGVSDSMAIPDWNDAPGRLKEEVATELRNAKARLV